jgi:hypothetical protein
MFYKAVRQTIKIDSIEKKSLMSRLGKNSDSSINFELTANLNKAGIGKIKISPLPSKILINEKEDSIDDQDVRVVQSRVKNHQTELSLSDSGSEKS